MDASALTLLSEAAGAASSSAGTPASKGKGTGSSSKPKAKKEKDPNAAPVKRKKKTDKNATTISTSDEGQSSGSRSTSIAPNQGNSFESGGNTPTRRKASAKASKAKSAGQRGSTRQSSRGSRGTSARASTSLAPGQQTQQDDEEEYVEASQPGALDDDEIDDDEEDEEGAGAGQGLEEEEWQRQEAIQKARSTAMAPLMKAMDDVQQDRYSAYRTSFLDKRHVKRVSSNYVREKAYADSIHQFQLILHLTGQNTTKQVNTLTASIARIFVGEIVESARRIQEARGASGPLRPEHLLEAHRLYKEEREVPGRFPPGTPSASAGVAGNGKRRRLF
jgi:transcription initiation factor TFIID subunit 11